MGMGSKGGLRWQVGTLEWGCLVGFCEVSWDAAAGVSAICPSPTPAQPCWPRALGFPQSHSSLHSSCGDSQAGAGSHAVCGHTLCPRAICILWLPQWGTGRPPTHCCPAGGHGSLKEPEAVRNRKWASEMLWSAPQMSPKLKPSLVGPAQY